MPDIILFGGEKGGTGKSFFARTVTQYYLDAGNHNPHPKDEQGNALVPYAFTAIDADRSNSTLLRHYPDYTHPLFFTEDASQEDIADYIFDGALDTDVLVNMPSQVHRAFTTWLKKKEILRLARENNIRLINWFVSDGSIDSLNLFVESFEELGAHIPHVFVKNSIQVNASWGPFEQNDRLQTLIAERQIPVIEIPDISRPRNIEKYIDTNNLTFAQARQDKHFGLIAKNQIGIYLRQSYAAIESTGLLNPVLVSNLSAEVPALDPDEDSSPAAQSHDSIRLIPPPVRKQA